MIEIHGRSGLGQDFELEFGGLWPAADACVLVTESAKYRSTTFFPESKGAQTFVRWGGLDGERRLTIHVSGAKQLAFDAAPEALQVALYRWVEKLASQMRKDRNEA